MSAPCAACLAPRTTERICFTNGCPNYGLRRAWRKRAEESEAENDALLARVAQAEQDAARLDWLEAYLKREGDVTLGWAREDNDYDEWAGRPVKWPESFWFADETNIDPPRKTLRAAIDAARTPSPTTTEPTA